MQIDIPKKFQKRFSVIASRTERSEAHCIEMALAQFLEDQEDYLLALSRIEENKGQKNISWEDAKKQLGLDDSLDD